MTRVIAKVAAIYMELLRAGTATERLRRYLRHSVFFHKAR
jgi:hypothetical protein